MTASHHTPFRPRCIVCSLCFVTTNKRTPPEAFYEWTGRSSRTRSASAVSRSWRVTPQDCGSGRQARRESHQQHMPSSWPVHHPAHQSITERLSGPLWHVASVSSSKRQAAAAHGSGRSLPSSTSGPPDLPEAPKQARRDPSSNHSPLSRGLLPSSYNSPRMSRCRSVLAGSIRTARSSLTKNCCRWKSMASYNHHHPRVLMALRWLWWRKGIK